MLFEILSIYNQIEILLKQNYCLLLFLCSLFFDSYNRWLEKYVEVICDSYIYYFFKYKIGLMLDYVYV